MKTTTTTTTSKERLLKESLLKNGADVLLAVISQAKDGSSRHPNAHPASQNKVWDALIPILQKVAERESIVAASNADVLNLLKLGKVNVDEAKELVAILAIVNSPETSSGSGDVAKKLIIEIASGGAT